jgi:hypothetical protein
VRSIAATSARDANESIGAWKTRTASLLQTGHCDFGAAVPIGRLTSKSPSWTHRYWYVAMRRSPLSRYRLIPLAAGLRERTRHLTFAYARRADISVVGFRRGHEPSLSRGISSCHSRKKELRDAEKLYQACGVKAIGLKLFRVFDWSNPRRLK